MEIIKTFENLPKIAKVLLIAFVGIISPIYRIIKFLESKNTMTLVGAILCFVPCVGTVIWVLDIVSELTKNQITFWAE